MAGIFRDWVTLFILLSWHRNSTRPVGLQRWLGVDMYHEPRGTRESSGYAITTSHTAQVIHNSLIVMRDIIYILYTLWIVWYFPLNFNFQKKKNLLVTFVLVINFFLMEIDRENTRHLAIFRLKFWITSILTCYAS